MTPKPSLARTFLYTLVFLLFFQLVADFIETIYTFGLLGTNIPPEIVSIVFFFSPLLLLFFRRGLPRRSALLLAGAAALMRGLEVSLDKNGKILTSGLGVGLLLVLLPVLLADNDLDQQSGALQMGSGIGVALALSILLRTLGAGSDLTLLYPWLSWLEVIGVWALALWLFRQPLLQKDEIETRSTSFWTTAALCTGIFGVLLLEYFAFTSPTVLARWSGVDYRLIIGLLAAALAVYFWAFSAGRLERISQASLLVWNALFLLAGTTAILINQVRFPILSSAYPFNQPVLSLVQQIPLLLMILLSPVALLDLQRLVAEFQARRPSPRRLAGGFALGALFFLIVVLGQVFTTVYDYIPEVGPWFRDRFWLVFLLAGLGMALPLSIIRSRLSSSTIITSRPLGQGLRSVTVTVLLAAFIWALVSQPAPAAPVVRDTLRVVTYNIQQGYSVNGTRNYAGQLAVIHSLAPDIVGLQESDVARFSGGNADVVRTIAQGLGMNSYYGPRTVTGTFGIALLSKYPLKDPVTFFMYSSGEQTAAIQAQITLNGQGYTILVTHLGNDGPLIQQQQVLQRLQGRHNVIAMGDFNFTPSSDQYKLTLQTLQDAWLQSGSVPTAGLDMTQMIDHVFVSPGVTVNSARYVNTPNSDHPSLLVEIRP
ncbi:MAG: endonuclease/exonuclease/phosphatase family protein [Anaerolineaceae bacterium]|nr:endonuclease/exonuclease/phosphatase family protein [Anaerolineaceae bacterium]